ncbi:Similar to Bifunctional P-450:NADPH-P450 reductase; acc. no. Q9Y8G7 [Pyronema omphalodes CBS 100304]|uniref:Similar to Bifunctional P-450:NADPH-P450 reductase acc. no. Q9Y8G7 n=1 Tax=Pyronema omphalodes (strain CBS 100304) TaxID=1076935 RepID=U4LWC6_PYROM|nr:Similar to Bifunctional P-450:NADPH-P450 reductase; acc. no. Q9Y8G7 [Pyronema omphalodes CBS 100304]
MYDIASELVMKWARHGPEHRILAADDFTRLSLDSLALCTMNLRFNSFYKDELHLFVHAMSIPTLSFHCVDAWIERQVRGRQNPKKDLLTCMVEGRVPKTGVIDNGLVVKNLITFLIVCNAGVNFDHRHDAPAFQFAI